MKIRLTESKLKRIVEESVKNILSELDWRTYDAAARRANKAAESADRFEKERRENQSRDFSDMAGKAYSKQYGLEDFDNNENLPKDQKRRPTQGELRNASRRLKDTDSYYQNKQQYKSGQGWVDKE